MENSKELLASDDTSITIGNNKLAATAERDPEKLPWGKLGVDVVIESTGHFRTIETAENT